MTWKCEKNCWEFDMAVAKVKMHDYAKRAMHIYGTYVIGNRAVPEFRDGLKPVHRAALWSAHVQGFASASKYHKCALLVGHTIGNYHPHGDCLRGDTVVPLLDGREVTIKELVESGAKRKWILAFDEKTGDYVPAIAHSWRVGQTTRKMYRVTFSTGETIEVTGNHPFYSLTRKKWVKAEKLLPLEELAGGILTRDTYPQFASNTSSRKQPLHHIVGDFRHGGADDDEVYHHVNENPQDNRPKNLEVLTRSEHAEHHGDYNAGLYTAMANAIRQCGLASKWRGYGSCSKDNRDKTVYHDTDYLKSKFGVGTVRELAEKIPADYLLLVRSVECVELPEAEDFYDFTVDGLHNMVVRTSAGSTNFVVVHNSACYEAIVGITGTRIEDNSGWRVRHCTAPMIEGYGNFGDFEDGPAAPRYTECKLTPIAELIMLDPDYLAVTDMIPNYAGTTTMPLVLPSKLPMMLVNGSQTLAVGLSGGIPSFTIASVAALTLKSLAGEITLNDIAKLVPTGPYGGKCVSTTRTERHREFIKTGKGALTYQPEWNADARRRTITVTSVCEGMATANGLIKVMEKLSDLPGVIQVFQSTGDGEFGITIRAKPRMSEVEFNELQAKVGAVLTFNVSYDVVRIERKSEEEIIPSKVPLLQLMREWTHWRIGLQKKVVQHRIDKVQHRIDRLNLLVLAADNLEIIMRALRVDDSEAYLVKHLRITNEQAYDILEMKVRQLKALEKRKLMAEKKERTERLRELKNDLKYPAQSAINDLQVALAELKKRKMV